MEQAPSSKPIDHGAIMSTVDPGTILSQQSPMAGFVLAPGQPGGEPGQFPSANPLLSNPFLAPTVASPPQPPADLPYPPELYNDVLRHYFTSMMQQAGLGGLGFNMTFAPDGTPTTQSQQQQSALEPSSSQAAPPPPHFAMPTFPGTSPFVGSFPQTSQHTDQLQVDLAVHSDHSGGGSSKEVSPAEQRIAEHEQTRANARAEIERFYSTQPGPVFSAVGRRLAHTPPAVPQTRPDELPDDEFGIEASPSHQDSMVVNHSYSSSTCSDPPVVDSERLPVGSERLPAEQANEKQQTATVVQQKSLEEGDVPHSAQKGPPDPATLINKQIDAMDREITRREQNRNIRKIDHADMAAFLGGEQTDPSERRRNSEPETNTAAGGGNGTNNTTDNEGIAWQPPPATAGRQQSQPFAPEIDPRSLNEIRLQSSSPAIDTPPQLSEDTVDRLRGLQVQQYVEEESEMYDPTQPHPTTSLPPPIQANAFIDQSVEIAAQRQTSGPYPIATGTGQTSADIGLARPRAASDSGDQPVWVRRSSFDKPVGSAHRNSNCAAHNGRGAQQQQQRRSRREEEGGRTQQCDSDTDTETDRLLGQGRQARKGDYVALSNGTDGDSRRDAAAPPKKKEVLIHEPAVLIEGVLFRANYLGSTQLICEGRPTKASRMMQAQEAVARIKSPDDEAQPSHEVDLFISTEKIMILNTDLQDVLMDHALRTISYIADIGDLVVLMARRVSQPSSPDEGTEPGRRTPKIICHVFESEEAQFIAQSIGQAFQVAYIEFLRANGIEDPGYLRELDYQEVLNSQEIYGDELDFFSKRDKQLNVVLSKAKGEPLGIVVVESGWGSMLPTVVLANMAPQGAAARSNQCIIGDQIISVNGISLVGLPLSACQQHIKNVRHLTAVKLTIVHTPPSVEVKIKRPDTKYQLGFSVQNGVICSLLRGGIAERGGVRVGHRIIEINGQSVVAVPHEKIVTLLATAIGEIQMKTMPTSMYRLLTGQDTPTYI